MDYDIPRNAGCFSFFKLSKKRKTKSQECFQHYSVTQEKGNDTDNHNQKPPSYSAAVAPASNFDILPEDVLETMESKIKEINSQLRDLSLYIHDNPELMFEEKLAHNALVYFMEKHGFTVTPHYLGLETAWRASFTHGTNGPVLGLNSEMDALPGLGHACGHNLIAIAGVGVAIGVKAAMEKHNISGQIILLGTPAEEGGGGKILLLKKGGYNDMDVCMMTHPGPGTGYDFSIPGSLAIQTMDVEYFGKTAHASARPWEGINALDAAVLAYSSISVLRQQVKPDNRIHGIIQGRDWAANVIPDYAKLEYIVRAPTAEGVKELQERVNACFEAAALATGCKCKITPGIPYSETVQNSVLGEDHINVATNRYGLKLISLGKAQASTDFGDVSKALPSLHTGYGVPAISANHTAGFAEAAATQEAHDATLRTVKALSATGLRVLLDEAFLKKVKENFHGKAPK